jgi:GNAT superfamily N-acetyltransferase
MMTEPRLAEIARICEFAEARAVAGVPEAAPPEFVRQTGLHVEHIGSAVALVMERADHILFNRVIGLGLIEPATEAMIDRIVDLYRPHGVRFAVQLSPTAQPDALPAWLAARGIQRGDSWLKFIRGVEPPAPAPTELRITAIGPELAAAYAETISAVFEMPPLFRPWTQANIGRPGWRHYLAFDGDQPVATAALFVRDGLGWLSEAGTLPAARGRGAQSALLARRITDATALGCRRLVVETGDDTPEDPNPSAHNVRRAGFQLAYRRPNYMP